MPPSSIDRDGVEDGLAGTAIGGGVVNAARLRVLVRAVAATGRVGDGLIDVDAGLVLKTEIGAQAGGGDLRTRLDHHGDPKQQAAFARSGDRVGNEIQRHELGVGIVVRQRHFGEPGRAQLPNSRRCARGRLAQNALSGDARAQAQRRGQCHGVGNDIRMQHRITPDEMDDLHQRDLCGLLNTTMNVRGGGQVPAVKHVR